MMIDVIMQTQKLFNSNVSFLPHVCSYFVYSVCDQNPEISISLYRQALISFLPIIFTWGCAAHALPPEEFIVISLSIYNVAFV